MAISSYGDSTDSSGVVRILKDLDINIEGRDVLVVEDIIDSGLTLSYLMRNLEAREPASLEICALLTKPERREIEVPVRYVGFEIPNRFVIGYGLDFAERYRNLPYVGRPRPDADSPGRGVTTARESGLDRTGRQVPSDPRPREPFLPQRALPADHHRSARLAGLADAGQPRHEDDEADALAGHHDGQDQPGLDRRRSSFNPSKQELDVTLTRAARRSSSTTRATSRRPQIESADAEAQRQVRLEGRRLVAVVVDPHVAAAVRPAVRLLDLPDEPGAGRRLEGDELRQVAREADDAGLAEDRLQGRRRRRRGGRGAPGDQGVPREPEEVPGARRAHPEGRAALRASRHR